MYDEHERKLRAQVTGIQMVVGQILALQLMAGATKSDDPFAVVRSAEQHADELLQLALASIEQQAGLSQIAAEVGDTVTSIYATAGRNLAALKPLLKR